MRPQRRFSVSETVIPLVYSTRQVHLYNPDNSALTAQQWRDNFAHCLFGFDQLDTIDMDELIEWHPDIQIWGYFQSHGLADPTQDWSDAAATTSDRTVAHNTVAWLRSAIQYMRDNELPGIADSDTWPLIEETTLALIFGDGGVTLVTDPGNESFKAFIHDVAANLFEFLPWNAGVFLDNTNPYSGTFTVTRKNTETYGDDKSAAWVSEMATYCGDFTAALNPSGALVAGNAQGDDDQFEDWTSIVDNLDAVMIEFCFTTSGEVVRTDANWLEYFNRAIYAGATNKYLFSINPENGASPNATKQDAIMACVGLVFAPKTSFRTYDNYGSAYALSSATALDDLGGPTDAAHETGTAGVWRRTFQNGYVEFNSNTGAGTISQTAPGTYTPATYAPLTAKALDRTDAVGDYVEWYIYAEPIGDDETLSYAISGQPSGIQVDSSTGRVYGLIDKDADAANTMTITVTATNGSGTATNTQTISWSISDGVGSEVYATRVNAGGSEVAGMPVWAADSVYHDASDTDSVLATDPDVFTNAPTHWPASIAESYRFDGTSGGNEIPYKIQVTGSGNYFVRIGIPGRASGGAYDAQINGVKAGDLDATTWGAGNAGVYTFTNGGSGYAAYLDTGNYYIDVSAGGEASPSNTARINAVEIYSLSTGAAGVNPHIVNPGTQTITRGVAVNIPVEVFEGNGNAYTLSASGLPAGLSIVGNNSIQGTTSAAVASPTIDLTATDNVNGTYTTTIQFTLNIVEAQAPVVTAISEQSGKVGETGSLQVAATSLDGGTLSYAISGQPRGKSIDASTGEIVGQYLTNDNAQQKHPTTVTVTNTTSNGTAQTQVTFNWWIKPGGVIDRIDCGQGGSNTATGDESVNWTLDPNASSSQRATPDSTSSERRQMMRGDTVPPWVPSRVQGYYRYGATMEYTLSAGSGTAKILNALGAGWTRASHTDVIANSTTLFDDLDPYLGADGGYAKTVMRSAIVTPDGSNNVVVDVTQGASGGTESIFALELLEYIVAETPVVGTDTQYTTVGQAVNIDLSTTVSDGGTLAYSATGLPPDYSINPVTGVVSGTQDYVDGAVKTYTPTITVTNTRSDGGYAEASQEITWILKPGTLESRVNFGSVSSTVAIDDDANTSAWASDPITESDTTTDAGLSPTGTDASVLDYVPLTLFESRRRGTVGGNGFRHSLSGLTPGKKRLVLYWMDHDKTAGQRQFHIEAQSIRIEADFDVSATFGQSVRGAKSYEVTVGQAGTLDVDFLPGSISFPFISAAEVYDIANDKSAPTITAIGNQSTFEGNIFDLATTITHETAEGYTLSLTTSPTIDWLSIDGSEHIVGTVPYDVIVAPTHPGSQAITVTVRATSDSDGTLFNEETFTLTVNSFYRGLEFSPDIDPIAISGNRGDAITPVDITVTDQGDNYMDQYDIGSGVFQPNLTGSGVSVSILSQSASEMVVRVSGTPPLSANESYSGTLVFTDVEGSVYPFDVHLSLPNRPPVIAAITGVTTNLNEAITPIPITATDPDGDAIETLQISGAPSGVTLVGTNIQGTPTQTGIFTITVSATDDYAANPETGTRQFNMTIVDPDAESNASQSARIVLYQRAMGRR